MLKYILLQTFCKFCLGICNCLKYLGHSVFSQNLEIFKLHMQSFARDLLKEEFVVSSMA